MKIQCQSCQAKYTIADEKVLGKVVKIRCKKCSSTIVVNGNELAREGDEGGATQVFDYSGASTEQWTVNVADGDQRTMSPQEIAVEYRNGTINDETYCWKEDMPDWLPLREIEPLYALVGGGHAAAPASLHEEAPIPSAASPLFGGQEPAGSPFAGYANGNGNGHGASAGGGLFGGAEEAAYAAPAPSAARRGGRGQGADLFGNVERAGGEEDVMTSAQVSGGAAVDGDKLTGQRNENSVLFSLSALTENKKSEPVSNRTTATGEGSGLIDIRALSQSIGSDDKKDSRGRVDDIMNLSGGGAFGAALAAPILAPPPMDLAVGPNAQEGKSNKTLLFGLIGGGAFIAVAIVLAAVLTRGSSDDKSDAKNTTETPSTTAVAANSELAATPSQPQAPAEQPVAATPPAPTVDDTPPPPGVGQATGSAKPSTATAAAKPAAAASPKSESHAASESAPAKAPDPPKQEAPKDFGAALAQAAGKPASEAPKESGGGGGSAPFDRGAAAAALSGVNVQSCKKPGGPTGAGHVKVTFAPNGSVSTAIVDDSQYPGTTVGGCVAGKFRGAHIPAFSGSSVTVGKGFTIN